MNSSDDKECIFVIIGWASQANRFIAGQSKGWEEETCFLDLSISLPQHTF